MSATATIEKTPTQDGGYIFVGALADLPPAPPAITPEQIAADLLATADVLERDGWFQGAYHCEKPGGGLTHCTLGAIGIATGYMQPGPPPGWTEEELEDADVEQLLFHYADDATARTRFWRAEVRLDNYLRHFGLQENGDIAAWNDETEGLTGETVAATVRAAAEWVAA